MKHCDVMEQERVQNYVKTSFWRGREREIEKRGVNMKKIFSIAFDLRASERAKKEMKSEKN